MSQEAFVRARRPEQKQQRREAILKAARELAERDGVRTVSLGSVAAEVGLAKSNLARYFATREEIYLELATQEWESWEQAVLERLPAAKNRAEVVDVLAETLDERPLFCDLLSHSGTTLEHNVSSGAARAFKLAMLRVGATIGAAITRVYPELTEQEAFEVATAAAGVAGLLYPGANPPEVMARLYATDPEVAAACLPFAPTLKRMLGALVAGLPSLR
ncbi:TetR/AcrR family transcriptional regulator [Amycolatopsis acidicola]|uniref:TetR/AcrR family transcriptional regulator n=1 Tax=Amycolatopsis acidicola TaxID=2596893 RepID=A0A5N0URI3_9PSEU|nr:TetR family transcriptional regulator [Amycolatopsis acidicola]KAA9153159.1 TetR/AcrR family transcriptional regulator [Amycolatopsis acidicola]